jgi:NitT/TauT family transport system substrate-binding protein
LPFFAAIEKGLFTKAGLDVEPLKFASARQVMEACWPVALMERPTARDRRTSPAQPGTFKTCATNPSNATYRLEQFIVLSDSAIESIGELGVGALLRVPA